MKNFAKFLVIALVVSVIAGLFVFGVSAAVTEPGVNPNNLKPGSDRVIFIQDAPRDTITGEINWNNLPGNGSGTSPEKSGVKPTATTSSSTSATFRKAKWTSTP